MQTLWVENVNIPVSLECRITFSGSSLVGILAYNTEVDQVVYSIKTFVKETHT